MGRGLAIVVCAALAAMLGGCTELVRRQSVASLKDDMAKPAVSLSAPTRPETRSEPPLRTETIKPEPVKPETFRADGTVVDRARAEQAARCGQRHIDHGAGTLQETENEKQLADAICVELHKYDHVR